MIKRVHTGLTEDWDLEDTICLPQVLDRKVSPVHEIRKTGDKDKVFVSYLSKWGMRYSSFELSVRMEELAEWLNEDSKVELPISEPLIAKEDSLPSTEKFRKQTISEALGNSLDSSKHGVTFFVGPVDGKVSFKMSICDLKQLENATREIKLNDEKTLPVSKP